MDLIHTGQMGRLAIAMIDSMGRWAMVLIPSGQKSHEEFAHELSFRSL